MVKLSDSTRRLVPFLLIVIVGSALLIFDIPILYLLFAMLFIALIFALFTGMLILSEIIADLREQFSEYRARIKAQTAKDRSERKKEREKKKGREEKAVKEKAAKEKVTQEKGGGLFGRLRSKDDKKKEKPSKADKGNAESPSQDSTQSVPAASTKPSDGSDLDLDDFDLDLDLDAELAGLDPEIGEVRTPFAADDAMSGIPSERDVSKLDIATSEEQDDISIDNSFGVDDDIDSIYSSTMDIGENDGEDMLANMEGGISAGDLAAYNSSDDTPYDYGGDDEGGDDEQYEASGSIGGGGGMDDDDLLASLKSDIDNLKKKDDNVLLRDLKDLKFTAQELVDELNEIVDLITKSKKR
jgi:hypothetical protein